MTTNHSQNRDDVVSGEDGHTVTPSKVSVTLRDGHVSISRETQTASLTATTANDWGTSKSETVAQIQLVDGNDIEVAVRLNLNDLAALRKALELSLLEGFEGP